MNRNLLYAPGTDSQGYRRYRLCGGCARDGILLLAVHGGGCRHWPGSGGHHHQFCFVCTTTWGTCANELRCRDPGLQQVRLRGDELEIGFVDAEEYVRWLRGARSCGRACRARETLGAPGRWTPCWIGWATRSTGRARPRALRSPSRM